MKRSQILLFFLLLSLFLTACAAQPEPYTYQGGGKVIEVYPAESKLVCGLDVYTYTVRDSGSGTQYEITYPNGSRYSWTQKNGSGSGGGSVGYSESRYISGMTLVDAIRAGEDQAGPLPWFALVLGGLGLCLFRFPQTSWYLRFGWQLRDAEPSDAVLGYTRFVGGAAMAVGALFLLIFLVSAVF